MAVTKIMPMPANSLVGHGCQRAGVFRVAAGPSLDRRPTLNDVDSALMEPPISWHGVDVLLRTEVTCQTRDDGYH